MAEFEELASTTQARGSYHDHSLRFGWAPTLANGAALIALTNIIGGVSNPDAAIEALIVPACLLAIGLMAGFLSLSYARLCAAIDVLRANTRETFRVNGQYLARSVALKEIAALNVEPLRVVFSGPGELENELQQLWARLKAQEAAAFEEADLLTQQANAELQEIQEHWAAEERVSRWANNISAWLCFAAFMTAIIGHQLGVRLQP